MKHILWPRADKFLENCRKVSYCWPWRVCISLHLHEENWSRLTSSKHFKQSVFPRGSITQSTLHMHAQCMHSSTCSSMTELVFLESRKIIKNKCFKIMRIFSGSKHISLSLHPVEVMLLRNLNSARHHNQWHHCHYMYLPKPTRVSASLDDPCTQISQLTQRSTT